MLWRIRPIEVRVKLFTPPRGKTWPAYYFVEADDKIIGELTKHPDTRTSKHPWTVEVWKKGKKTSLGVFGCLQHAVERLLKSAGNEHCPYTITFDPGSVGGRPFDFGRAYSVGDEEDRVHLLVMKNPGDGTFTWIPCSPARQSAATSIWRSEARSTRTRLLARLVWRSPWSGFRLGECLWKRRR